MNDTLLGGDGDDTLADQVGGKDLIDGGNGNDSIVHWYGSNDTIRGGAGNDRIVNSASAYSLIDGGPGDDEIHNYYSGNTLTGGPGRDVITNYYSASNTYLFNRGDGLDIVTDFDYSVDTIQFGAGITLNDLVFERQGTDLLTRINGTSDIFQNVGFFVFGENRITHLKFADGSSADTLDQLLLNQGTSTSDTLHGTIFRDHLKGLAGNDTLNGGDGNDLLEGGLGNDSLNSGNGDDRVSFSRGHGQDWLFDTQGVDTVQLGAGIRPEDVTLSLSTDRRSVILKLKESTDQLGFWDMAVSPNQKIETLLFSETQQTMLTDAYLLTQVGGTLADTLAGTYLNDSLVGLGGNDRLLGGNGDDALDGGLQDDWLQGGVGNDTLIGGLGNDALNGQQGDDVYLLSLGSGRDTIADNGGGVDTVRWTSDINRSNTAFWSDTAGNLLVDYGASDGSDRLTIAGWRTASNGIERFEVTPTAGGRGFVLSQARLQQALQQMSAYAVSRGIALSSIDHVKQSADLMGIVASAWQPG